VRVVLDAGPVIHRSWVHRLGLLDSLFEECLLPPSVRDEVLAAPEGTLGLDDIREALHDGRLRAQPLPESAHSATIGSSLPAALGAGEREAIALAAACRADLLITDDGLARSAALRRRLAVTGTLGVLRAAREAGLLEAVLPPLLELRSLGFRISDDLIEKIRREEQPA
jgi:predicted nucleic acid-binding protein